MKCLIIQLEPEIDTSFDVESLLQISREGGRFPEVDNEGKHIYLNYFTEDLKVLWQELQVLLLENELCGTWLKRVSVIVCEGEEPGSELLLHHRDSNEQCDLL